MNILNRVTLQYLKKSRVRTIVTIVGIILSTAMFTAVTTSIASIRNYMLECIIDQEGRWEGAVYSLDQEKNSSLLARQEIADSITMQEQGYLRIDSLVLNSDNLLQCLNEWKPYLLLGTLSDNDSNLIRINLISGRYPENSREILIPSHLASNGRIVLKAGDTLRGTPGIRTLDGVRLDMTKGYVEELEEFEATDEAQTYTVVGFYERADRYIEMNDSPGYLVLTGTDTLQNKAAGVCHSYFTLKRPSGLFEFLENTGYDINYHSDLLRMSGISKQSSFRQVFWGLGGILAFIILFGSVALIYNAFSISVNERIRQFGLLTSIGATKKQLKRSVLFEACMVSLAGIPIGILSGIAGMGITFFCLRDRFLGIYNDSRLFLSLHVEPWCLLLAAAMAFFTVLISAALPARRALRVTAIDAIRQNSVIQYKGKQERTSRLKLKLFGLEGVLAERNFKRNRKKYRATVISLFVSIVLFISASSFVDYLKSSINNVVTVREYDLMYSIYREELSGMEEQPGMEELFNQIKALEHVDALTTRLFKMQSWKVSWDSMTPEYINFSNDITTEQNMDSDPVIFVNLIFLEEEDYKTYLEEQGLNGRGYYSEKKEALAVNSVTSMIKEQYVTVDILSAAEGVLTAQREGYRFTEEDNGIEYYYEEAEEFPYVAVSGKLPMGDSNNYLTLIYPVSAKTELLNAENEYVSRRIYFQAEDADAAYDEILNTLFLIGMDTDSLVNVDAEQGFERNLLLIVNVFSYGFIILISLIAAANVFHTISTNISLRRREFAMLESVGMTRKSLYRMLNYECLRYGMKSLILGLPASALVTYGIYKVIVNGYETEFYLPAASVVIAVGSVFMVVFSTMLYSAHKLKKNSLVETLKNEAI